MTSLSLPASASVTNAAASPACHAWLEGAVGFFGACASGWVYSLSISGRLLSANPRVIPASVRARGGGEHAGWGASACAGGAGARRVEMGHGIA